ncbi:MAG: type II toxin-antitoxin system VapC family toxin [Bacteroidota bacterium]
MGSKYLLDSNIAVYLMNGTLKGDEHPDLVSAIQDVPCISVISRMELLGWTPPTEEEADQIRDFVNHAIEYNLTEDIILRTIEIRKSKRIKLPDAIIAATALSNDLILLTRNTSDFKGIPDLICVNPVP